MNTLVSCDHQIRGSGGPHVTRDSKKLNTVYTKFTTMIYENGTTRVNPKLIVVTKYSSLKIWPVGGRGGLRTHIYTLLHWQEGHRTDPMVTLLIIRRRIAPESVRRESILQSCVLHANVHRAYRQVYQQWCLCVCVINTFLK